MRLRDKLTSDIAELLLDAMRNNGWLTNVTDDAGIYRKKMNRRGIGQLRVHQLLRLLVALCFHSSRRSRLIFIQLWAKMGQIISEMADDADRYDEFLKDK